jgi:CheY-like chemotaxis protein
MPADSSGLIDILLVEDERADVMLTVSTLREAKLANRVNHAGDAIEALAYLRREDTAPPDLVLLDLGLPGMSGHDLLREIRGDRYLADLHVVVLSGDDRAESILDSYAMRVDGYIVKPMTIEALTEAALGIEDLWLAFVRRPGK